MPIITLEGEDHEFPANATDEHISKALKIIHAENVEKKQRQDKLIAGLSPPAQPENPILNSNNPKGYEMQHVMKGMTEAGKAESRNDLEKTIGLPLAAITGGVPGLIGSILSPGTGQASLTGGNIAGNLAAKALPGGGAVAGLMKGIMGLLGSKAGDAAVGNDTSLGLGDAIQPAAGALTGLARSIASKSAITKSQALMDALKQKLSGGVVGNATQPAATDLTAGIRSDVNAASAKLAAAEAAPEHEKALLAEQIKAHKNAKDAAELQIKDIYRKLQPGEDPRLNFQAKALTKEPWQVHDAADAAARDKELALKAVDVKATDPKLAEQRLKDANIHDITNGRAVLDNLSKAKTGEEFNDLIYKGGKEYIQVAKRMIGNDPKKLEQLRDGFVSHVAKEAYDPIAGKFSAKGLSDRLDTESGQSVLKELYPDVKEINHKIADVKSVLSSDKGQGLKWFAQGNAAGVVISFMTGHHQLAAAEAGVAGLAAAKIGMGTLVDTMLKNDNIRAAMLDYAKTGTVDNVSRAAANAFHAFLASHEVKKPSATPPIGQTTPNSLTPATTPPNPSSEIQSPPLSSSAQIR